MRIIGGIAGGIRLSAPEGRSLRPTEDRVKESMFGALGDLRGRTVVDFFSGTGALGLEALSRGASHVFLFEASPIHAKYIGKNIQAVQKAMGAQCGEVQLFCTDVRRAPSILSFITGKIDILLADPPYASEVVKNHCYGANDLVQDSAMAEWTGSSCLLVLEHASANKVLWHPSSPWHILKEKTYGIRAVSFARQMPEEN